MGAGPVAVWLGAATLRRCPTMETQPVTLMCQDVPRRSVVELLLKRDCLAVLGLYEGLQAGDIEEAILYQLPAYATRSAKISSIYRWHQLHSCIAENPTSNLPS